MGVPSFYRWLANRYPKTVVNAVEYDGSPVKDPKVVEFDNLYLDMNGIIHPCFHPEDLDDDQENSPKTYDEVFNNIFEYIDRIMNIVRPNKILYMAIDGVAPRAKMNQQRSRRFRTAKDRKTLEEEEDRLRKQYEHEGKDILPKVESDIQDSNIITPGTEFMYELSNQLQTYIRLRIANHPAWRSLRVILSDANSPGEGEHKIMSFIRLQRTCNGYDPNTSHVLYGLDADLIMLALATHEIHFSILRENVLAEAKDTSKAKSDLNRGVEEIDTTEQMSGLKISEVSTKKSLKKKPYQFLRVWTLREYLKLVLKIIDMPEKFEPDVERLIDDFIFICFFAGNDFLPHMPTLEIHEGAIDLLMHVYTKEFKNLGGYLVNAEKINDRKGGYIKLKRVEKFILAVGAYEDRIFTKRSKIHDSKLRHILSDVQAAECQDEEDLFRATSSADDQKGATSTVKNTKALKEQLKSYTREKSDIFKNGLVTDSVKFGSPGWKNRYYKSKFSAETEADMEKMRKIVVEKYTEGLCWVLLYYFSDVPSWTWFYPFHYGPFASDLKGLSSVKISFNKGLPFKPFDQLMAVLPPTSAHALPAPYESLMTDEESNILDFYPSDFDTDTDGKRFLWQGVCKLPFINEDRLLSATKNIEKELSADEAKRNTMNLDKLFLHSSENLASRIISSLNDADHDNSIIKIDSCLSGDVNGFVRPKPETMKDPDVVCVYYELPCFCVHIPRVLAGSTIPESVVSEADIEDRQLWHDSYGYHNNRNNRYNNSSVGFRNSSPNVINVGAGSGWNPRGRGSGTSGSSQDATRNRGWWENNNPHGRGTTTSQGSASGYYAPSNYHTRTNGSSGQFWSVRSTDSNLSSNRSLNRWGETRSRHDRKDANVGGWRKSN
ncbi:5'-3' exoribonuclease 3-like [Bidens hawaiensis]|uniref:5'-3' exoribonuclease 3-like n=1 Tax=Bidens hawaiensis TaxID=980011 RepID=UPI00404B658B